MAWPGFETPGNANAWLREAWTGIAEAMSRLEERREGEAKL